MSGRIINERMDPSLRKGLADLEIRRKTLLEAMSKVQDAKQSALFQYLNNNENENENGDDSEKEGEDEDQQPLSSSSRCCACDETEGREDAINTSAAARQDTSDDRDCYNDSRRDSIPDTTTSIRHDNNSCSNEPTRELRGRRGGRDDNIRVGCDATTTNENVADNEYEYHEDDPMSLLERKLNMMVSKKPLWQKALQDLDNDDDELFGSSKVSESATTSSSGITITKPPSEAEIICSIDITPITTTSSSTTIGPTATAVCHQEHQTMKPTDPSAAGTKVGTNQVTTGNNTNDAERDAIESWHSPSICSMDSPCRIGLTTTTDRHHHQENETNRVVDSKAACLEFGTYHRTAEAGTSMDDEENYDAADEIIETIDEIIGTIESRYIQTSKNYFDNLSKCLSDLHATSSSTTHGDTISKAKSELVEKNCFGNAQTKAEIESLRTAESECSTSPLKEEEQMVFTTTPQTTEGQLMVVSQDEKQMVSTEQTVSTLAEQQHTSIEIMYNNIQSNEQNEDEIESPQTTEGQLMVVSQDEEQMVSTHMEQKTMSLQSNPRKEVTIESLRIAESNDIEKIDGGQTVSIHAQQHHIQSIYFQSNQWEMIRPDAHLETPRVSNATKQLFYLESEKVVNTNLLQLQKGTPQQSCSESDVFGDIDLLSQERCDVQNVTNRSDYFDWGVASDLSDDSTESLDSSSSTDCSSEEMNNHDVENDDENDGDGDGGIGEQDSEESSMKPPIPNEVTMLTDFTVQSITCTFNNSNMESLGEESLVQEIQQPNGNKSAAAKYVMSSNSESTIIGEKRNNGQKACSAPNATELKTKSYTEGLLKVLKTTSLLCQCTGPDAVNDVYTLVPR